LGGFLVGLMFFLAGVMMILSNLRFTHPAVYLFLAAVLITIFPVESFWAAIFAKKGFSSSIFQSPL